MLAAASPDGIIGDDRVLEIKCPFTAFNKPITPATVPFLYEENGVMNLINNHDYYYQVQGQMLCTNRKHCTCPFHVLKHH